MSTPMTSADKSQDLRDLLDTTKNYEHLAFLKGAAGLYYRAGIAFALGLFGLLILQALDTGAVFYDKGFFGSASQFTITQIGLVVVIMAFLGDISFAFTRFITDQRYTEYLAKDHRAAMIRKFSTRTVIGGVLVGVPTIFLAVFDLINAAQAWALIGIFLGVLFLVLAQSSGHKPSLIIGGMMALSSIFIALETIPGPYWVVMLMIVAASCFVTAIASYLYAERQL